ncbi:MAG: dynamin family protein [Lachnospiraceae bacterium]|nr:dynamin family protein [Lachnospiraceae bacterium]
MKRLSEETRLSEIIRKYYPDPESSLWEDLIEIEKKTDEPDIIVPVLGTQGAGKSTLINALLSEDIMPSEVDETTCIPVEIRYGKEKAEVFYKDGTTKLTECNKKSLSQYVDNTYNAANKKKISHIVLHKEYPILKSGLVIVDLPGVLSLTKENEETTKAYIKTLCAAVFLISTSRPIGELDSRFISIVWRGISTAYFVQNVWTDNCEKDVRDAKEYNDNILRRISDNIGADYSNEIIPVNVYNAAKGIYNSDTEMVNSSNIKAFKEVLEKFAQDYKEIIKGDHEVRVRNTLSMISEIIKERIIQSQMDRETLLEQLKNERKQFNETSDEIDKLISDSKNSISKQKKASRNFAECTARNKTGLLKSELYHLIDQGVVDGDMLNDAFKDYQMEYGTQASEEAYEELFRISKDIKKKFEGLEVLVEKEMMESFDTKQFYKEQQFKWEKAAGIGIGMVGSVGSFYLSSIIAGSINGIWAGPAGILIGMAMSVVAVSVGNQVKRVKTDQRADETRKEIMPSINEFELNMKKAMIDSFENYFANLRSSVDDLKKSRQAHLDSINDRISSIMKSGNDITDSIDLMTADLGYINGWE